MNPMKPILTAAAAALLLVAGAGAANLTVVSPGLGPGTSATCPSGCKLAVNMVGDTVKAFVESGHPESELVYRFQFFIDVNNLPMVEQSGFRILEARKTGSDARVLLQVILFFKNGVHKVRGVVFDDQGVRRRVGQFNLKASGKSLLEFEWAAASGESTNDGLLRMKKGINVKGKTDVDNYFLGDAGIDETRLGYVKGSGVNIAALVGTFYLDEFASFRTLAPF